MPELLLVHDPSRIDRDVAIAHSLALGIPAVVHGLAPWMAERGLDYGADGYLVVVVCAIPSHAARREVLSTFKDAAIRRTAIMAVRDHDPDPPTEAELRQARIQ